MDNETSLPGSDSGNARVFLKNLTDYPVRILLIAILFYKFCAYCLYAWSVIHYPFEIDYGEGIVWQQAALIPGPRMYGDINVYPFIVFHYPPLYHLVVHAISSLTHADMLMVGRGVSVASTLLIALLIGGIVHTGLRQTPRPDRISSALIAGLLPFSVPSIVSWSVLMRVDMLAIALCFAGLFMAVHALSRPRRIYAAMPFFVAAVFAKQTAVAEFVSVFAVFMVRAPRTMLTATALAGIAGLAILGGFLYFTDGRILQHLVSYNVNRLSLDHGLRMVSQSMLTLPAILFILAVPFLYRTRFFTANTSSVVEGLRSDKGIALILLMSISLVINSLLLSMLFKSGSNVNYFIEWYCVQCVLIGLLMVSHTPLVMVAQLLLALKILAMPMLYYTPVDAEYRYDQKDLLAIVQNMPGPVLSDNMVLLMKAGKQVPYEPSIFAELGSRGKWDEHKITDLLNAHFFDAVVTYKGPGNFWFDERYLPDTIKAMLEDYPCVQAYGDYRLRTAGPVKDLRSKDAAPVCNPNPQEQ